MIDDSKNIYDQINLRKFYSNAVKRCEDRRNLPSFAEIAQFEIKDWILQYIFRKYLKIYNIIDSFEIADINLPNIKLKNTYFVESQIRIETLTKEEIMTILDALVGIEESGMSGKHHKAPPVGNIGKTKNAFLFIYSRLNIIS